MTSSDLCKLRQYLAQQMFKLACRHFTIELSSVPEFHFRAGDRLGVQAVSGGADNRDAGGH